jgi:biopolymer transport protein TolR
MLNARSAISEDFSIGIGASLALLCPKSSQLKIYLPISPVLYKNPHLFAFTCPGVPVDSRPNWFFYLPSAKLSSGGVDFAGNILYSASVNCSRVSGEEEDKMSMALGIRGSISSEINVTPMIDVLLVLLIIFMVVFPYQSVGESTDIPQQRTDITVPPNRPVVIQIKQAASEHERPALRINDEETTWEKLGSRLEEIYSQRMDKVAFLKGDPEIDFQYVADAVDIAHHAGVVRLGLMGNTTTAARTD